MPKPTRTAAQLQALIQERIDAIPELRGQVTDIQAGGIVWKQPSGRGANWTVKTVRSRETYRADVAGIIRQVQDAFDLED